MIKRLFKLNIKKNAAGGRINNFGFTLVETLVYLALFAILFGGSVVTAYNIMESNQKNQTKSILQDEGDFLTAKINWALSGAQNVNLPAVGSTGSLLSVNKVTGLDANNLPVITPITLMISGDDLLVGYPAGSKSDTGTAEAGAATTLTDIDKAWAVNQWRNGTVTITGGTGSGQKRTIASNTATVITVTSAWTTNPGATSIYSLHSVPISLPLNNSRTKISDLEFNHLSASGDGINPESIASKFTLTTQTDNGFKKSQDFSTKIYLRK